MNRVIGAKRGEQDKESTCKRLLVNTVTKENAIRVNRESDKSEERWEE